MDISVSKKAAKQLSKVPAHIKLKFEAWCDILGYKGFHDEPLQGKRKGQRSVRLSKSYRAIYKVLDNKKYELIEVIEVNKHDYQK